jgi:putative DNA primase/helicase
LADGAGRGPADVEERARRYVAKMPPAVSGQNGHGQTFEVAVVLMRGFGLTVEQARPVMQDYNARCSPPWSDREIEHKLTTARDDGRVPMGYLLNGDGTHEPPGKPLDPPANGAQAADGNPAPGKAATDEPSALGLLNDTGNAERFARRYADRLRHCWPWKKWLVWDGRRWRVDERGRAEKAARVAIKRDLDEATKELAAVTKEAAEDPEDKQLKARVASAQRRVQFLLASLDRRRIDALLAFARSELPVGHDELNTHPNLLNCLNGTLGLETGVLRPHRREDCLTTLCRRNYRPDAPRETFERFLATVLPSAGLRRFVRQLFGLGLIGKVHEHVLPILWGAGRNGKTTLMEAVQATLGPDYADTIPPELLLARKGDGHHPTEIADLFGKRIISAAETKAGHWLNTAAVKRFTGGDTLKGRRMREDFWSFPPSHTIFVLTNSKPKVDEQSLAIWSRLKLVPFATTFYKPSELPPGADRQYLADPGMLEKLLAEAEGILAWMVEGCLDWRRNGLVIPEEVEQATGEYRQESDVVTRFLAECTRRVRGARYRGGDLYARFLAWLKANGEEDRHLCSREFGIRVGEAGVEKMVSNGVQYLNIAPAEATDEDL